MNPDFSQVEADQQVTNLSRFEISYPKRRQFFIENQDLFANFGFERSRPFFSRRIGISRDTNTGVIVQNPLLYGARLSGKLDRNWRVGILNTQTARQESRGIPGQNYTVAVLQRQIFGRSTISALLMNRSEIGGSTPENRFTRLAGLEYNLQTADNRWSGKVFYHQAFKPQEATQKDDRANEANAHGLNLTYTSRNLTLAWRHEYIGRSYRVNDIGYVPRRGYWKFVPSVQTTFYVKGERGIVSHGPFADALIIRNIEGGLLTDRELNAGYGGAVQEYGRRWFWDL